MKRHSLWVGTMGLVSMAFLLVPMAPMRTVYAQTPPHGLNISISHPFCPCTTNVQGKVAKCVTVNKGGYPTCWVNSGIITCPGGEICPWDSYGLSQPCQSGGGGGGCCGPQPAGFAVFIGGQLYRVFPPDEWCSFQLNHILPAPRPGERDYVMDEWALYDASGELVRTSSIGFGKRVAKCIAHLSIRHPDSILVVGYPPHYGGSPHIVPTVNFMAEYVPPASDVGQLPSSGIMRVEFNEKGAIERIAPLYGTSTSGASAVSMDVVRHMINLQISDEIKGAVAAGKVELHRSVVYLSFQRDADRIRFRDGWVILPLCCQWCGPPPAGMERGTPPIKEKVVFSSHEQGGVTKR